jgi:ribonucleotide reductase beta subunit family protein with ferritin-like domain
MIENKIDEKVVHEIFIEAVDIEKEFITDSISCNMIGMNAVLMKEYIEFVSDRLLVQLGYNKIWNTENPFDFMELISLRPKSNFFEVRVGEYSKSKISETSNNFELCNDF